jgi:copper transport protein
MAAAIGSGIGLACWQIVEPRMLISSAYGITLSGKIVAVLGLVIAIVVNRRIAARNTGNPALQVWIVAQIGLLILALVLTAALGELTPPRHLLAADRDRHEAAMPSVVEKTVDAGNAMASIRLEPIDGQKSAVESSGGGQYRLTVSLMSMSDGKQLTPEEISVALSNLDVHIGPLKRGLAYDKATGSYVTPPLVLVPAGHWRFDITADLDDFDRRNFVLDEIIGR